MEFSAYQQAARETSQLRLGGPQGAIAPMLGLASETGSILNVRKKYLRDGIGLAANREFLREELGDLLWYAAAVANACGLDLEEIAEANLRRTRDRYPRQHTEAECRDLPVFDAGFPARERFPRRLVVAVTERVLPSGRPAAALTLVSAEPDAFPDGPVTIRGKLAGYAAGAELGDPLTDNTRRVDAYRFHDAIHLGFMAVLGWSPVMRALLRLKRKSSPQADECEDGARAVFAEEGLAAVLSRLALGRTGFLSQTSIDGVVIEVAKAAATGLEAEAVPGWLWQAATWLLLAIVILTAALGAVADAAAKCRHRRRPRIASATREPRRRAGRAGAKRTGGPRRVASAGRAGRPLDEGRPDRGTQRVSLWRR